MIDNSDIKQLVEEIIADLPAPPVQAMRVELCTHEDMVTWKGETKPGAIKQAWEQIAEAQIPTEVKDE